MIPGFPATAPPGSPLTFSRLKWTSFVHSAVYLALLIAAFAAGKPEPLTQVLGWTHGLLWISMSAACLTAVRLRIVPSLTDSPAAGVTTSMICSAVVPVAIEALL